jgi:hypothetical protein
MNKTPSGPWGDYGREKINKKVYEEFRENHLFCQQGEKSLEGEL